MNSSLHMPVSDLNSQLATEESDVEERHLFFSTEGHSPKVLHDHRQIQIDSRQVILVSKPFTHQADPTPSSLSSSGFITRRFLDQTMSSVRKRSSSLLSPVAAGNNVHPHANTHCDGCTVEPIVGTLWTCIECKDLWLCSRCYRAGIHGYEHSHVVSSAREECAVKSMTSRARGRLGPEVFELLMTRVCRGQVAKFKFLASWLVDVVLGQPLERLKVLSIEIPALDVETRQALVTLLTPKLVGRLDVEVSMEWFNAGLKDDTTLVNLRIMVNRVGESQAKSSVVHHLDPNRVVLAETTKIEVAFPVTPELTQSMLDAGVVTPSCSPIEDDGPSIGTLAEPDESLSLNELVRAVAIESVATREASRLPGASMLLLKDDRSSSQSQNQMNTVAS